MYYKEICSTIAIGMTFFAFFPYIRGILKNEITPHLFSWIIWGITTSIVFLAQMHVGGGVGAWPTGISGTITLFIAFLAFIKRGDLSITKTDWFFFIGALSSLPFWYITSNPLWAVVLLTSVDLLGFGPTIRKAYDEPHGESIFFFFLFVLRNGVASMALEQYSITTLLFPASTATACLGIIGIILFRKQVVCKST